MAFDHEQFKREMKQMHEEHDRAMKEIDRVADLERRRFPFQALFIMIAVFATYGINEWVKIFHFAYWKSHPWVAVTTLICMPIFLFIAFQLPKLIIRR